MEATDFWLCWKFVVFIFTDTPLRWYVGQFDNNSCVRERSSVMILVVIKTYIVYAAVLCEVQSTHLNKTGSLLVTNLVVQENKFYMVLQQYISW
jgi:hypothetical protein